MQSAAIEEKRQELEKLLARLSKLVPLLQSPTDLNAHLKTVMDIQVTLEAMTDLAGDLEEETRRAIVTNVFS